MGLNVRHCSRCNSEVESKYCPACGQTKPATEFYVNRSNKKDGLQDVCKECGSKRCAERYEALKSGELIGTPRTTARPIVPMREVVSSRNYIGDASELLFATIAIIKGWNISWPFSNMLPYDCILDSPEIGGLIKVQIKTVNNKRNARALLASPCLSLKTAQRRGHRRRSRNCYKSDDFDMLAAVSPTRTWLIPWPEVCNRARITLDAKYDKYIIYEQNT